MHVKVSRALDPFLCEISLVHDSEKKKGDSFSYPCGHRSWPFLGHGI